MNRRDFLNGSVLAATAGLALDACAPEASQIIPILVPEEPFVPGEEEWIRSTCLECNAACGIEVRKIDGRLVKVEGNPDHPMSRGGLCARGQAIPQSMYHPDRIRGPLAKQSDGAWSEIGWDEALDRVATALTGDTDLAFLTGAITGHRNAIVDRFLRTFGVARHLVHEPFGTRGTTQPVDIDNAGYVISFGAELLESPPSPVRFHRGLAELRQGRPGRRGKLVMVGPRLSLTAANADEWIPARPGEELEVALGIARVLIRDGLHQNEDAGGFDRFRVIAEAVEVTAPIERIAHEMAAHRPTIAVAGRGAALASAVSHLNTLLGTRMHPTSAPSFQAWPPLPGEAPEPVVPTVLTSALEQAPPAVLLVAGTNPLYSLPPSFHVDEWFSEIPLRVSFASILDETAAACDLVLPESMSFERFEDVVPEAAPVPMATLAQPLLVRTLYDTRAMPDVLIEIARRAGREDAFPWSSYEGALREAWSGLGISWSDALSRGGFWGESADVAPVSHRFDTSALEGWSAPGPLDLELHVYASTPFGDGRSAHLPFLQELSDPITGVRWGSVVEIAAERAEALGIRSGDLVEVRSESGAVEAPAHVTPGIHPNVVAIAAGQGHRDYGRYARGRGVNAFSLLRRAADGDGPLLTGTEVSIRKVSS